MKRRSSSRELSAMRLNTYRLQPEGTAFAVTVSVTTAVAPCSPRSHPALRALRASQKWRASRLTPAATRTARAQRKKSGHREATAMSALGEIGFISARDAGTERACKSKQDIRGGRILRICSSRLNRNTGTAPASKARQRSSGWAPMTGNRMDSLISATRILHNLASGSIARK